MDTPDPIQRPTSFRATPDQIEAWKAIAAAHGLSYSDWIRRVLDGVPLPPPPTPLSTAQAEAVGKLGFFGHQLAKLGSNLNQLTRMAHEGQNVTEQVLPVLTALVTEVASSRELLQALLDSALMSTNEPSTEAPTEAD